MSDVVIGKGKLSGKGLYAARNFKKGEVVKRWNLKELSQAQFNALPESEYMFVHSFWGKMYLFSEPSRYINHSVNPNVVSNFEKKADYAARSIKKGEAITTNATMEVLYELETFIKAQERESITNFKRLKGGYRNATASYRLPNGTLKKVKLQRIKGNWHIL